MSKITAKRQITIPKRLADDCGIAPGDEVEWSAVGGALRLAPSGSARGSLPVEERLALFDAATGRIDARPVDRQGEPARPLLPWLPGGP